MHVNVFSFVLFETELWLFEWWHEDNFSEEFDVILEDLVFRVLIFFEMLFNLF